MAYQLTIALLIAARRTPVTWKPLCVTCHQPIGYTAKEGWYVGRTECRKCRP